MTNTAINNISQPKNKKTKGLRIADIVLFTFSAVFILDSFTLSITYGWESIIWWIILGIIFFLPYGLIVSELGSTYGNEGGIYNWTKKAYGSKMAGRTNYYYWINVAFWMPSVYLVLCNALFYSINPKLLEYNWIIWVNAAIAIVATWITVALNQLSLEDSKWVPNISSIIRAGIVIILLIGMIMWFVQGNAPATNPSDSEYGIQPNFATSIGIIGIIVFSLCGFELSSNVEIENPKKTMPKSIGIGGITILFSYLLIIIPILTMVDVSDPYYQEVGYTSSIVMAISAIMPQWMTIIVAILLAISLMGNISTWTIGANGAIVEAAENNEFAPSFAKKRKNGAPIKASYWLGIISTIVILLAGLLVYFGQGDLWYILFSFSLIVFFIPYMIIFLAYIKLRKVDKDVERPFGITKNWIAKALGYLAFTIIIIATFAQIFEINLGETITITPYESIGGWWGILACVIGLLITFLIGEWIITKARKNNFDIENKNKTSDKFFNNKVNNEYDNLHIFKCENNSKKNVINYSKEKIWRREICQGK